MGKALGPSVQGLSPAPAPRREGTGLEPWRQTAHAPRVISGSRHIPTPVITSRQHPFIKSVRRLESARERQEAGQFLLEGTNALSAAQEVGWPLLTVLHDPAHRAGSELARLVSPGPGGATRLEANAEILAYAARTETSPGIIATAALPAISGDWTPSGLILVLDGVSDPGNLGTLIRAADAAGASHVIVTAGSADPWQPKVVRAAAGSLLRLPPLNWPDRSAAAVARALAAKGVPIVTAEAHGGTNCYECSWPGRVALVLGNERHGPSAAFAHPAARVTIPNYGRAESLNVAMAGTLLLYAWRQNLAEAQKAPAQDT